MSQPQPPSPADPPSDQPSSSDLQRQAVSGSLWTVIGTAGSIPLTLLSLVVAGRVLGPAGFGEYSLYAFYLPLAQMVLDLGLTSAIVWSATTGRVSDPELVRTTLRGSVTWSLLKAPVLCALAIWLLRDDVPAALALAAVTSVSLAGSGINVAVVADRRFKELSQVGLVSNAISAAAVIAMAALTQSPEWSIVGFWLGKAIATPLYWRAAPPELRRASVTPGRLSFDRRSWSFGLSSYVASVLTTWVFGRSELVFLQREGSAVDLGRFALTTTVAQRATLLADALYGALGGALMALRSTNRSLYSAGLSRALRVTTLLAIACSAALTPVVSIVGTRIFGEGYGDVVTATAVLLQFALLKTANEPINSWVFSERNNRALVIPGVIAAGIDVGLCLVLIPRDPFLGAVVANLVSSAVFIAATDLTAGLPAEARRHTLACLTRVVAVGTISASITALPLTDGTIGRTLLATGLVLCANVLMLTLLPPLFERSESESVARHLPSRLRLVFSLALLLFNGGAVHRRLRTRPA